MGSTHSTYAPKCRHLAFGIPIVNFKFNYHFEIGDSFGNSNPLIQLLISYDFNSWVRGFGFPKRSVYFKMRMKFEFIAHF